MCGCVQVMEDGSDSDVMRLQWPKGSKKRRSRSRSASCAGSGADTPGASCVSLGPETSTGSVKRPRTGPRAVVRLRQELAVAAERHGLRVAELSSLAAAQPQPALPDEDLMDVACRVRVPWAGVRVPFLGRYDTPAAAHACRFLARPAATQAA